MAKKPLSRKRQIFFLMREVDRELDRMKKAWSLGYGVSDRDKSKSYPSIKRRTTLPKSARHGSREAGETALAIAEKEIEAAAAGRSKDNS